MIQTLSKDTFLKEKVILLPRRPLEMRLLKNSPQMNQLEKRESGPISSSLINFLVQDLLEKFTLWKRFRAKNYML